MGTTLDTLKVIADCLLIPIMGMVWSVQGRISKLEGKIEALNDLFKYFMESKK